MTQPGHPEAPSPAGDAEPTWEDFERRLATALGRMLDATFLVLVTPGDEARTGFYVQFAAGDRSLRAEAVSSRFLPADRPLTPEQEGTLRVLGWLAPGSNDDPSPNYFRVWPSPVPFAEVARLVVRTLRDAYGVTSPAGLRHTYRSLERVLDDPDLGTEPERPAPQPLPHVVRTAEEVRPLVERALEGWLGLSELVRDADGDYPIRVGSALMYVQVLDGVPPLVRIFSPILHDVGATAALFEALNEINARIRFGRVLWAGRQVIIAMELTAADITAAQVVVACTEIGNLADHLDDGLHGRFGGATAFTARPTLLN